MTVEIETAIKITQTVRQVEGGDVKNLLTMVVDLKNPGLVEALKKLGWRKEEGNGKCES